MTVKKYQFYIDTKKQEEFYKEIFEAKYLDKSSPSNNEFFHLMKNDSNYFQTIQEVTVNSGNRIVRELFERNKIPLQSFFYVYRNYSKVKICFWGLKEEKDLPNNTVITNKPKFFKTSQLKLYQEKDNTDIFHIVELQHPKFSIVLKEALNHIKTPFENLCFLQRIDKNNLESNKFNKKLKYKMYLDSRLLIERMFPEDLREDKSLVEEVYLDIKAPKKLTLVSDDDLYIVKIVQNDKTFYPNSKEFILEP